MGTKELQPVPIPSLPLTSTMGMIGAYLQVTEIQIFRYSDAVHRRYKTKICKKFGRQPCYVHKQ